jgi:hypothetical protein
MGNGIAPHLIQPANQRNSRRQQGLHGNRALPGKVLALAAYRKTAPLMADEEMKPHMGMRIDMLDVDPVGFDVMDRKLLEAVLFKFGGGPVGISNLAAAIGEEVDTIEDVLEPYLIQQGYLQRTPRGRVATASAYRHFGVAAPATGPMGDLWDQPDTEIPS